MYLHYMHMCVYNMYMGGLILFNIPQRGGGLLEGGGLIGWGGLIVGFTVYPIYDT